MRLLKILIAAVIAMSVTALSSPAYAIPITAVWTGTVTNALNPSQVGQTITMSFSYTSEAVSASNVNDSSSYTSFSTNNNPNFYSNVSMSLSGGLSFAISAPILYSEMLLGEPSDLYRSIYYNHAFGYTPNYTTLQAYFYNTAVGGITNTNPASTFSYAPSAADPYEYAIIYYEFTDANNQHHNGYARSSLQQGTNGNISVTLNGASVPAPGALVLLGLGLLGIGAMLRKRKKAA